MRFLKLIICLALFSLKSFSQASEESEKLEIFILRYNSFLSFPFYSDVKIDGLTKTKLRNGQFVRLEIPIGNHIISISKKEFDKINESEKSKYYVILFRKRFPWRRYELIEVTESYFNQCLESVRNKYFEVDSESYKTIKWI